MLTARRLVVDPLFLIGLLVGLLALVLHALGHRLELGFGASAMAAPAARIPFTAAAHRYREKIFTTTWTPGAAARDVSPPGGAIKSYGYLRSLYLFVSTQSAGTGGNLAADAPWNAFSQLSVTQPNGEEMYGGPTFSGFHAYLAAQHSAWKLNDHPSTLPSAAVTSATAPQFSLPIIFEMNQEYGLGSLPNQDFSAPWKLQATANTSGQVYQTAPTTAPTLQLDVFMDCWTVPSPRNPLNPNVEQDIAPPLLGTLNKWTVQQYAIAGGSNQNVLLQRKGNAIRNLIGTLRNSSNARIALSNYPNPLSIRWDGTVIRANDSPTLIVDDYYRAGGGVAAATPVTADVGVLPMKMADLSGIDAQGVAEGFGMNAFWGTVQSSTLEYDGTWGATAAVLEMLTNDVQFVNLAGNPYAFAYAGYLQAPAQPNARP